MIKAVGLVYALTLEVTLAEVKAKEKLKVPDS
jgi:hypothetical protein